jgi:gas vesicle protein
MFDIGKGRKIGVDLMIGTAIGAAAGSVLGVIFAPKPGQQTRQQLRTWLKARRQQGESSPKPPHEEPNHWEEVVLTDGKGTKTTPAALLIGTALGGIAGSVLGVLFAPKSGQQTRQQLRTWLKAKRQSSAVLLTRLNAQAKHKKEQIAAVWQASRHAYAQSAR